MMKSSGEHRRGRSMGSYAARVGEKDEDLALFHEMKRREKHNFLHPSPDDLDATLSSKFGGMGAPTKKIGNDLLTSESDKNDYDWLLTPPGTPLFPSLDQEAAAVAVLSPALSNGSYSSASSASRSLKSSNSPADSLSKGSRSNPSPRRPVSAGSTPNGMSRSRSSPSTAAALTRPSPAAQASGTRPSTPTTKSSTSSVRASHPNLKLTISHSSKSFSTATTPTGTRPSTPTPRSSTPPVRPSTPGGRSSTPTSKPSTPTMRRSLSGGRASLTSVSTTRGGPSPKRTTSSSRGNSPSGKRASAVITSIAGMSTEAPPNLRTSLTERPASNGSRAGPESGNHADDQNRRRPRSPSVARSFSSSSSQDQRTSSQTSRGSVISSYDDGHEVNRPSTGSTRDSSAGKWHAAAHEELLSGKVNAFTKRLTRSSATPKEISGSVSTPSKKSSDLVKRPIVDAYQSSPTSAYKHLHSSSPGSPFLSTRTNTMHLRPASVMNSSVTTSSNASSEHGTTVALDTEGSERDEDDLLSWDSYSRRASTSPRLRADILLLEKDEKRDKKMEMWHDSLYEQGNSHGPTFNHQDSQSTLDAEVASFYETDGIASLEMLEQLGLMGESYKLKNSSSFGGRSSEVRVSNLEDSKIPVLPADECEHASTGYKLYKDLKSNAGRHGSKLERQQSSESPRKSWNFDNELVKRNGEKALELLDAKPPNSEIRAACLFVRDFKLGLSSPQNQEASLSPSHSSPGSYNLDGLGEIKPKSRRELAHDWDKYLDLEQPIRDVNRSTDSDKIGIKLSDSPIVPHPTGSLSSLEPSLPLSLEDPFISGAAVYSAKFNDSSTISAVMKHVGLMEIRNPDSTVPKDVDLKHPIAMNGALTSAVLDSLCVYDGVMDERETESRPQTTEIDLPVLQECAGSCATVNTMFEHKVQNQNLLVHSREEQETEWDLSDEDAYELTEYDVHDVIKDGDVIHRTEEELELLGRAGVHAQGALSMDAHVLTTSIIKNLGEHADEGLHAVEFLEVGHLEEGLVGKQFSKAEDLEEVSNDMLEVMQVLEVKTLQEFPEKEFGMMEDPETGDLEVTDDAEAEDYVVAGSAEAEDHGVELSDAEEDLEVTEISDAEEDLEVTEIPDAEDLEVREVSDAEEDLEITEVSDAKVTEVSDAEDKLGVMQGAYAEEELGVMQVSNAEEELGVTEVSDAEEEVTEVSDAEEELGVTEVSDAEDELEVREVPDAEDELGVSEMPDAEDELGVREVPDAEDELGVREVPDAEDELGVKEVPDAEHEPKIRRGPEAEDELGLRGLPDAEDELGLRGVPDAEDELGLREVPDTEEELEVREVPDAEEELEVREVPDAEEELAVREVPDAEEELGVREVSDAAEELGVREESEAEEELGVREVPEAEQELGVREVPEAEEELEEREVPDAEELGVREVRDAEEELEVREVPDAEEELEEREMPDPEEELGVREVSDAEEELGVREVSDAEEELGVREVSDAEEELGVREVSDAEEELGIREVSDAEEELGIREVSDAEEELGVSEVSDAEDELEVREVSDAEEEHEVTEVLYAKEELGLTELSDAEQEVVVTQILDGDEEFGVMEFSDAKNLQEWQEVVQVDQTVRFNKSDEDQQESGGKIVHTADEEVVHSLVEDELDLLQVVQAESSQRYAQKVEVMHAPEIYDLQDVAVGLGVMPIVKAEGPQESAEKWFEAMQVTRAEGLRESLEELKTMQDVEKDGLCISSEQEIEGIQAADTGDLQVSPQEAVEVMKVARREYLQESADYLKGMASPATNTVPDLVDVLEVMLAAEPEDLQKVGEGQLVVPQMSEREDLEEVIEDVLERVQIGEAGDLQGITEELEAPPQVSEDYQEVAERRLVLARKGKDQQEVEEEIRVMQVSRTEDLQEVPKGVEIRQFFGRDSLQETGYAWNQITEFSDAKGQELLDGHSDGHAVVPVSSSVVCTGFERKADQGLDFPNSYDSRPNADYLEIVNDGLHHDIVGADWQQVCDEEWCQEALLGYSDGTYGQDVLEISQKCSFALNDYQESELDHCYKSEGADDPEITTNLKDFLRSDAEQASEDLGVETLAYCVDQAPVEEPGLNLSDDQVKRSQGLKYFDTDCDALVEDIDGEVSTASSLRNHLVLDESHSYADCKPKYGVCVPKKQPEERIRVDRPKPEFGSASTLCAALEVQIAGLIQTIDSAIEESSKALSGQQDELLVKEKHSTLPSTLPSEVAREQEDSSASIRSSQEEDLLDMLWAEDDGSTCSEASGDQSSQREMNGIRSSRLSDSSRISDRSLAIFPLAQPGEPYEAAVRSLYSDLGVDRHQLEEPCKKLADQHDDIGPMHIQDPEGSPLLRSPGSAKNGDLGIRQVKGSDLGNQPVKRLPISKAKSVRTISLSSVPQSQSPSDKQSSPEECNAQTEKSNGFTNSMVIAPENLQKSLVDEAATKTKSSPAALSRNIILAEATDTILYCSSLVHTIVYKAAAYAIEKEELAALASTPTSNGEVVIHYPGLSQVSERDEDDSGTGETGKWGDEGEKTGPASVLHAASYLGQQTLPLTPEDTSLQIPMDQSIEKVRSNEATVHTAIQVNQKDDVPVKVPKSKCGCTIM